MTQGRKSRTVRALACLLGALLVAAAIAPAIAAAQTGAEEEYQLSPNIPNPDKPGGQDLSAGGDTDSGTSAAAPTDTAPPDEPSATQATASAGGDKGGKDERGEGSAQAGADPTKAPTASAQVPSVDTSSSDDGGAPVLLILLAAIAAVCTGVAVWRMRREPSDGERSRGAEPPTTGATRESQSV